MEAVATYPTWESLYSMEGPPGKERALAHVGRAIERFPRLQGYLTGLLLDGAAKGGTGLRNQDLRTAVVVADLADYFDREGGSVPDVFYRALRVLPPHDKRTLVVLGETNASKKLPYAGKLARLADIAAAPDPEAAFREMNKTHGIGVHYKGEENEDREETVRRMEAGFREA